MFIEFHFRKRGKFQFMRKEKCRQMHLWGPMKSLLPSNSLLDHKFMESLHRKHFHKSDKEGVWLAISSWPEGEGIVYPRKKIPYCFHNIIMEEGSVNNYGKRSTQIHGPRFERWAGKLYFTNESQRISNRENHGVNV